MNITVQKKQFEKGIKQLDALIGEYQRSTSGQKNKNELHFANRFQVASVIVLNALTAEKKTSKKKGKADAEEK